jgi:hypothetical protein
MSVGVFTQFLSELDEQTKEKFVAALDEADLFDFCDSQEEFSVITGRDPKRQFHAPDLQDDVKESEVKREKIQERFDKFQRAFPQTQSLDALKEHARMKTQPTVAINISLGEMRERANNPVKDTTGDSK